MGLFKSIFGKKDYTNKESDRVSQKDIKKSTDVSTPQINYVHTKQNSETIFDSDNNVLVLWWISKKKNGYDRTSNSYPKWFDSKYGIVFNQVMEAYIQEGSLSNNGSVVVLTEIGSRKLKEYDYVVYLHEHAQYALSLDDFRKAENLHKVQNSDIAWGVFNRRIQAYTINRMWESLAANYGNMADLLVKEKRFERALEFIFAAAYLETSGMRDGNELTPIFENMGKKGRDKNYLSNGMPDIFLLEINNYYVTAPFIEVQKSLNLEWSTIRDKYLGSMQIQVLENNLPFRYFEKEESFEIFKEAVIAGRKKGVFPLRDVSRRLKTNTPNEHSRKYFYASTENIVKRQFENR